MVSSNGQSKLIGSKAINVMSRRDGGWRMEHKTIAFWWTCQDEAFFALFFKANNVIVEDGLIIKIFEEIFLNYRPDDSLIILSKFFKIIIKIEMSLIAIRFQLMHGDAMLIFYVKFLLFSRFVV